MKAPIIENWSDITGIVRAVTPSTDLRGFMAAEVVLSDVRPVPDFANLLEGRKGQSIPVNIPQPLGERLGLKPGCVLRGRVRQAGTKSCFVHPELITLLDQG